MRALLLLALLACAHAQDSPLRVRRVRRLRRPINGGPVIADGEVVNAAPNAAAPLAPLTEQSAAAAMQTAAAGPLPDEAAAAEAPKGPKALSNAPPTNCEPLSAPPPSAPLQRRFRAPSRGRHPATPPHVWAPRRAPPPPPVDSRARQRRLPQGQGVHRYVPPRGGEARRDGREVRRPGQSGAPRARALV